MKRTTKTTEFITVAKNCSRYRLEVHKQLKGNMNYVIVRVPVDEFGEQNGEPIVLDDGDVYTVLTKDDSCGRGDYAEELDVQVDSHEGIAAAKRIAQMVLEAEYEPGLRVARVIRRVGMF